MEWHYNDGGRKAARFRGAARDCACRSIAIATEQPYRNVYAYLNLWSQQLHNPRKGEYSGSARTGVSTEVIRRYLDSLGWKWTPTMGIGTGCHVHLRTGELPIGRLIVRCSRHVTAVIDGVIHDTSDPSRKGMRCVYGYWTLSSPV